MTIVHGGSSQPAAAPSAAAGASARSRRLLLISLLLAAAGVALLLLYMRRYETDVSGGTRVQLLTVISPAPRGTVLTEEMLGVREVPVSYVEPRAVKAAELAKVRGIRTAIDLDPQDSLLWTDLAVSVDDRDVSALLQPGNRAFSVEARQGGAAGNDLIRPGDYVDVLATFSNQVAGGRAGTTVLLLQRVLVLAVGNETQRQAFQAGNDQGSALGRRAASLTLSLKIEEAQMMALAVRQAELSVVLRSAGDSTVTEGLPNLTPDNLLETATNVNRRRSAQVSDSALPTRIGGTENR
jgi:pilus assembly protein CpaB